MTQDEIVDCVVARGAPYAGGFISRPKPLLPGTWVYMFPDGDTAKRVINKGWIPGGWYQRIPWSVLQRVCDP